MMMRSIDEDDGNDINEGIINVVRDKANKICNCQSCISCQEEQSTLSSSSQHYDRYHHTYYHIQYHI